MTPFSRVGGLAAASLDAIASALASASPLQRNSYRIAVTGLQRAGKTVFVTSFVHALLHAKPVLLIDDDEREILEIHPFLEKRMGSHGNPHFPRGDQLESRAALLRRHRSVYAGHIQLQWCEPALQVLVVLLRQQLSRSHQGNLHSTSGSTCRGRGSHNCFSAANITLYETHHGPARAQISIHIAQRTSLGTSKRKRQ